MNKIIRLFGAAFVRKLGYIAAVGAVALAAHLMKN